MERIRNRFGLPVQSGEFIHIKDGICHILSYVEEWEDAPEDSSGYRDVFLLGLEIGKMELRARIINDRGFAELDSEYKQSIAQEPLTQEIFDHWISGVPFKPVTVRQFCERIMDIDNDYYFVKFARGCLYQHEISQIEKEWCEFKIREKLPKPDAGTASKWVDEWLSTRPELDAPWIVDEMFTQISLIEEPSEWDGKKHPFVGKRVFIREMKGEPQYTGKTGTVTFVDDAGQIHGTWGGCALTVDDDYDFLEPKDADEDHYFDGFIDVRVIRDLCLFSFVSARGECKAISFDDGFFSPRDLLWAYNSLFRDDWGEDRPAFVEAFKQWLMDNGCKREELEEDPEMIKEEWK